MNVALSTDWINGALSALTTVREASLPASNGMKVIMLKDVGGVGRHGTVVEVSDGFALNSLIPRGLAVQATAARLAEHAATQKRESSAQEAKQRQYADYAKKIEGTTVVVSARANQFGGLFNQIHPDVIVEALSRKHGISIPPDSILINAPIKNIGDTTAKIKLGESEASFIVQVVQAK